MKLYLMAVIICCVHFSCKKETTVNFPAGVYVEETLRLDTIDFTKSVRNDLNSSTFELRAKPFTEPGPNPTLVIMNSSIYSFIIQQDSIALRSYLSSNNAFFKHKFNWTAGSNRFEIGKFYFRNALSGNLRFVKL